jgi:PEP-CTERM motif
MQKLFARLAQIVAALAIAGAAQAIPFTIAGGSGTPVGVAVGSTVTVVAASDLAGTRYNLFNAGDTTEKFDFLKVTLSGYGGALGVIDANLDFLTPDVSAPGVLGGFGAVFGLVSGGGLIVVDDGGPIAFDGGVFDVNFFGFDTYCFLCTSVTGTVQASITLLSTSATSVPEPGTLSLLSAGLVAVGLMRRRKTKVQQAA